MKKILGIGNALVDVLGTEDDAFLERLGMVKGSMTLIDTDRAEEIYAALGEKTEASGGSAANTLSGVASFGAPQAEALRWPIWTPSANRHCPGSASTRMR